MTTKTKIAIVGAIVVVAAGIFAKTATTALFYAPDSEVTVPSPSVATASSSVTAAFSADKPLRMAIPALKIDAAVQYVGVNAKGNMGVPNNFTDVGWYKYGTVPGAAGSAVIAGHVDNGLSLPGVFKHLNDIKKGDDIFITTKSGAKLHFVVDDIENYPYTAVPTDLLFNQKDAVRLNLITCDGSWVQGDRTYDHRFVVFSKLAT